MSSLKNVSNKHKKVIRLMNKDNLFKKIVIYEIEDCKIFYCITFNNKLHISGSKDYGFPSLEIMLEAFNQLTDKEISDFQIMKTEKAFYLLEKENLLN